VGSSTILPTGPPTRVGLFLCPENTQKLLIATLDARIARAHQRLKEARTQGHPSAIAERERQLDTLLEQRHNLVVE